MRTVLRTSHTRWLVLTRGCWESSLTRWHALTRGCREPHVRLSTPTDLCPFVFKVAMALLHPSDCGGGCGRLVHFSWTTTWWQIRDWLPWSTPFLRMAASLSYRDCFGRQMLYNTNNKSTSSHHNTTTPAWGSDPTPFPRLFRGCDCRNRPPEPRHRPTIRTLEASTPQFRETLGDSSGRRGCAIPPPRGHGGSHTVLTTIRSRTKWIFGRLLLGSTNKPVERDQ